MKSVYCGIGWCFEKDRVYRMTEQDNLETVEEPTVSLLIMTLTISEQKGFQCASDAFSAAL